MSPSVRGEGPTLSDRLRNVLEQFPDLVGDSMTLARRLVPALSEAGLLSAPNGLPSQPSAAAAPPADPAEAKVFAAIRRHPSGQHPGLAPDALAHLSGVTGSTLARAVSSLVQSGVLVRDAWLVRLPHADDLLPHTLPPQTDIAPQQHTSPDHERRAVGDRRSVGERRLFDRRSPP